MHFNELHLLFQELIDVSFCDPSFHFLWQGLKAVLPRQSQSGLLLFHLYLLTQISAFGPLRRT